MIYALDVDCASTEHATAMVVATIIFLVFVAGPLGYICHLVRSTVKAHFAECAEGAEFDWEQDDLKPVAFLVTVHFLFNCVQHLIRRACTR